MLERSEDLIPSYGSLLLLSNNSVNADDTAVRRSHKYLTIPSSFDVSSASDICHLVSH